MPDIILPHQLSLCFDQLAGTVRPRWEDGLSLPGTAHPFDHSLPLKSGFQSEHVLIHCHVFYVSMLPELVLLWQSIPLRHIVITTPYQSAIRPIKSILSRMETCSYDVIHVPNRGRDIAPFLFVCSQYISSRFDLVIHCHTKRSLHSPSFESQAWRRSLLLSTFPPPERVAEFLTLFRDQTLATIYPWPHRYVAHNVNWGRNFSQCQKLFSHMCLSLTRSTFLSFPAGSFFWIRLSCLAPLLALHLRFSDFKREPLPSDGTLAHALERLIGVLPFFQDYKSFAYWAGPTIQQLPSSSFSPAFVQLPTRSSMLPFQYNLFQCGLSIALSCHRPTLPSILLPNPLVTIDNS